MTIEATNQEGKKQIFFNIFNFKIVFNKQIYFNYIENNTQKKQYLQIDKLKKFTIINE